MSAKCQQPTSQLQKNNMNSDGRLSIGLAANTNCRQFRWLQHKGMRWLALSFSCSFLVRYSNPKEPHQDDANCNNHGRSRKIINDPRHMTALHVTNRGPHQY